jgi:hypothetical protein
MAESTLSITYEDLQSEVGEFLHYGQDTSSWSADETKRVDRLIQAGIRQFYFPPQIEGVELGYQWSFMRPSTTIDTVASQQAYAMPDDFSAIVGDLTYETDVWYHGVTGVSQGRIQELNEYSDDEDKPRHYTTRFKTSTGASGQRQEMLLWPIPDAVYTLTYRYEAYSGKIDAENFPYPLGGMKYGECIIESCLAIAERRGNDEAGIHEAQFIRLLANAVALDRRNSATRYGPMGGCEDGTIYGNRHGNGQTFYQMSYKGDTW